MITDESDKPVQLIGAFYHPAFGIILAHRIVFGDEYWYMSAKLNDPTRAQNFADEYRDSMHFEADLVDEIVSCN